MMDLYKYLNSRAIENYLRKTQYKLSSLECAWIVFHCTKITLAEKIDALKYILTMPDYCIEYNRGLDSVSLHQTIQDYFVYVKDITEELTSSDDNSIYTYSVKYKDRDAQFAAYFKDYGSCVSSYNSLFADSSDVIGYEIHKTIFNTCDDTVKAEYRNNRLTSIHKCGNWDPLFRIFLADHLFIHLPTPFKPGDILFDTIDKRAVVFEKIPSHTASDCKTSQDMNADCYYISNDGKRIEKGVVMFYTDLEYYKGELTGQDIALTVVSDFIKTDL